MRVYTEIIFIFIGKKKIIINQHTRTTKEYMSTNHIIATYGTPKETGIVIESRVEEPFYYDG